MDVSSQSLLISSRKIRMYARMNTQVYTYVHVYVCACVCVRVMELSCNNEFVLKSEFHKVKSRLKLS